ncbi:MAG: hypothetical protein HYU59_14415 [Magnetospirillum gryphiswaldense]|nr:hypothetical protein [Magnetospirillum gryphiswaldense]
MANLTPYYTDDMSGAGNGVTNVLSLGNSAIGTCNGYAFLYDFNPETQPLCNDLKGVGKAEVRMALDGRSNTVFFGCNGHVQAVNLNNFEESLWSSPVNLPSALNTLTNVLGCNQGHVYAAANGYVYKINSLGSVLYNNSLDGTGNHEVRLALSPDQQTLFAGTNGEIRALSASDLKEKWRITLPAWNWNSSVSSAVSVLGVFYKDPYYDNTLMPWLFASCNGWIYAFDLTQANLTDSLQVAAMTPVLQSEFGAGDASLTFDLGSNMLYVGLSGCAACLDASLRRPPKWTYENFKSSNRPVSIAVGVSAVYVGTNGQLAQIESGKCIHNNQIPDGGTNPVSLSLIPVESQRLITGANGYLAAYSVNDTP